TQIRFQRSDFLHRALRYAGSPRREYEVSLLRPYLESLVSGPYYERAFFDWRRIFDTYVKSNAESLCPIIFVVLTQIAEYIAAEPRLRAWNADDVFHGAREMPASGTIKRERAAQPVSYRRAGEHLRRMPPLRRGFGSSLQRQVLRDRFWQTRLIYLRPTLRCGHSWIQRLRP